jgi:hypothetical protein
VFGNWLQAEELALQLGRPPTQIAGPGQARPGELGANACLAIEGSLDSGRTICAAREFA